MDSVGNIPDPNPRLPRSLASPAAVFTRETCATRDCPFAPVLGIFCQRCTELAREYDRLELEAVGGPLHPFPAQTDPDPEPGAPAAPQPEEPAEEPMAARSLAAPCVGSFVVGFKRPSRFDLLPERLVITDDEPPVSLRVIHALRSAVGWVRAAFCAMPSLPAGPQAGTQIGGGQ